MNINWYPGHMAKAKRMLLENIKLVDLIFEVLDSRIPISSKNPDFDIIASNRPRIVLLSKADLSDKKITEQWLNWYKNKGITAIEYSSSSRKSNNELFSVVKKMMQSEIDRYKRDKGVNKTIRVMVAGIPNVGKSTLINSLAKSNSAKTGDKPGVTRGKQWIKVNNYFEIMDTPGLLWPNLNSEIVSKHLAYVGSIKDEIIDQTELCINLIGELKSRYGNELKLRYKIDNTDIDNIELLNNICKKRGWIMSGGVPDVERGAKIIIDEFRGKKIGAVSLEAPEQVEKNDESK